MTSYTLMQSMPKFFENKRFKALNSKWRAKLKKRGFIDHEDEKENLYDHDRRTVLFDNRERILNFFLRLDSYLHTAEIPPLHRQILELYSNGIYLIDISKKVGLSYRHSKRIIKKYKDLLK